VPVPLAVPALSRAELAELDRIAIERYAIPGVVLMENAGRGACEVVLERLAARGSRAGPVGVVCGPGNNGGDGWVVARHLANAGVEVVLAASGPASALGGDAATMRAIVDRMRLEVVDLSVEPDLVRARERFERCGLLVDAVLGTGFTGGAVRPAVARAIRWIVELTGPRGARLREVVALDLPSGLDADLGTAADPVVEADRTVTFAAPKLGFALPGAGRWTGEVRLAGIGVPAEIALFLVARRAGGQPR
jgi:NAD(P)H-hydrate epimerase